MNKELKQLFKNFESNSKGKERFADLLDIVIMLLMIGLILKNLVRI